MQVSHPARRTSQAGIQGTPVSCVPRANGVSAGAPRLSLCGKGGCNGRYMWILYPFFSMSSTHRMPEGYAAHALLMGT